MKKMMIAAVAIAFATATQAATVWWQNALGAYGDADNDYAGAVYLMTGGSDAASAFVSTVVGATDYKAAYNTAIAAAIGTMNYGTDYSADISSAVTKGTAYDFFVVALDEANKGVYVSDVVSETIGLIGDTDIYFDADSSYTSPFAAGVTTYAATTGGWYTAVPEPTSGLLMLLGMAGLALKRKRV